MTWACECRDHSPGATEATAVRLLRRTLQSVVIAVVLTLPLSVFSAADQQIRFKRGATSAHATGYLSGGGDVCYLVKAHGGQHMKAEVEAKGATVIEISTPTGEKDGEPGGMLEEDLAETGDYRICVSEHNMGEHWKGQFTLTVEIH
jgi:hypothetical protein